MDELRRWAAAHEPTNQLSKKRKRKLRLGVWFVCLFVFPILSSIYFQTKSNKIPCSIEMKSIKIINLSKTKRKK
jgi:hypothetical protein